MPGSLATWPDGDEKHDSKMIRGQMQKKTASLSTSPSPSPSPEQQRCFTSQPIAKEISPAISIINISASDSNTPREDGENTANAVCSLSDKVLSDFRQQQGHNEALNQWDPFHCGDGRENAFARLLSSSSSSSSKPRTTQRTPDTQAPSTPISKLRETSSPWKPFASGGDNKENRGRENAFSKMLAGTMCQQRFTSGTTRSTGKGSSVFGKPVRSLSDSVNGKRKRPRPAGPSVLKGPVPGAGAGARTKAGATTRFCECPVCGKRVIIELCSNHLDTECGGAKTSSPLSAATDPPPSSTPEIRGTTSPPKTLGCPAVVTSRYAKRPPTIAQAGSQDSPAFSELVDSSSDKRMLESDDQNTIVLTGDPASTLLSISPLPTVIFPPSPGRLEGTTYLRRQALTHGAKGVETVTTVEASSAGVMTSCPVCGQQVKADLCSLHLDTDCAGVMSSSPPPLNVETSSSIIKDKEKVEGGASCSSSPPEVRNKEKESETAGGMSALAAELTCPVCLCLFEDAHALPCSHRFCHECITECFRSSKKQECPLCKVPAWKRDLKRDIPLQNIILAYRQMAA